MKFNNFYLLAYSNNWNIVNIAVKMKDRPNTLYDEKKNAL